MKKLITLIFIVAAFLSNATNYYIKNGGNDAASGLSDALAWGTIAKVNSEWAAGTFAPGDSILFKKGDSWSETITVGEAGTNGNNIIIGSYSGISIAALKEQQTTTNQATNAFKYPDRTYVATQFVASDTYNLSQIEVNLTKVASPTMNINCYLYSDDGTNPTTLLATSSTTLDASTITDAAWHAFTFDQSLEIVSSSTYWIVLKGSAINETNHVSWNSASSGGDFKGDEDGTGAWPTIIAWHGSYKVTGVAAAGIAKPIITAPINTPAITVTAANRGYITVNGLDLRATGSISGMGSLAIYFNYWPDDMGSVPGWVIQNCTFNACIFVSGPDILIKDNVFDGTGNASNTWGAIRIRGTEGDGAIVEGNTISNYADRGVWFYNGAPNVTVRNNTIFDIAVGSDQSGAGVNNDGYVAINPDAKIYGNTIYNCGYGISHENALRCETFNNTIYNSSHGMTIGAYEWFYGTDLNQLIHNNLLYNNEFGFALFHPNTVNFYNNTIYTNLETGTRFAMPIYETNENVYDLRFVNNIIAGNWAANIVTYFADEDSIWGEFDYNYLEFYSTDKVYNISGSDKTLAQTQALGHMTNGFAGDPLLVNPPTDFRLQSSSPAIDAGVDVGLTEDYAGHKVPYSNGLPDIGAYEWGIRYLKINGKLQTINGKLVTITQ